MPNSRTKGKAAELEVVRILRESGVFPDAARDLDQVRGHDNGRDIINTDPWVLQVKRRAKMDRSTILRGLSEASDSATPEARFAACVHRSDRAPWRVTCDLADLTWYFCEQLHAGTTYPVTMTLEDWCGVVRDVERG